VSSQLACLLLLYVLEVCQLHSAGQPDWSRDKHRSCRYSPYAQLNVHGLPNYRHCHHLALDSFRKFDLTSLSERAQQQEAEKQQFLERSVVLLKNIEVFVLIDVSAQTQQVLLDMH
jgi:hypothetical protein